MLSLMLFLDCSSDHWKYEILLVCYCKAYGENSCMKVKVLKEIWPKQENCSLAEQHKDTKQLSMDCKYMYCTKMKKQEGGTTTKND